MKYCLLSISSLLSPNRSTPLSPDGTPSLLAGALKCIQSSLITTVHTWTQNWRLHLNQDTLKPSNLKPQHYKTWRKRNTQLSPFSHNTLELGISENPFDFSLYSHMDGASYCHARKSTPTGSPVPQTGRLYTSPLLLPLMKFRPIGFLDNRLSHP